MNKTVKAILHVGEQADQRADLRFFGAFRSPGARLWDLIVSVNGLPPNRPEVYVLISDLLRTQAEDLTRGGLNRIVVLSEDDPRFANLEQLAHGRTHLKNFQFGEVDVAEAYLLPVKAASSAAGAAT